MFYLFVICIILSVVIVGTTFAYFTASAKSDAISGKTDTTTFGIAVSRVTTIDIIQGLIPMKNEQSPNAALKKCEDDSGYAGCQIYKVVVTMKGENEISLDGYVHIVGQAGVENRFTRVYTEDNEATFNTYYTIEDFDVPSFSINNYIKTGKINSEDISQLNPNNDSTALFINNETLTVDEPSKTFYLMLWAFDNGENQNHLMGMKNAFSGDVLFRTSYGNEIKATFA